MEQLIKDRRKGYRRRVERRQPKAGVNVRHDDDEKSPPKRVRAGKREREEWPEVIDDTNG